MTRADYDVDYLIRLLQGLKSRYPHLQIILEPGSLSPGRLVRWWHRW